MNKILLLLLLLFVLSQRIYAQLPPTDSSWELKFVDQFDSIYPSFIVDTSKWVRSMPWGQNGSPEVCNCNAAMDTCDTLVGKSYFTQWADNAANSLQVDTTGSGTLKIIARKQNYYGARTTFFNCGSPLCTNPACATLDGINYYCAREDSVLYNYTTAMLYSKFKFKYGYFELKFKIQQAPTLPATNYGYTMDWWLWDGDSATKGSSEIDMFEIRGSDSLYTNNVHYYSDSTDLTDDGGNPFFHGSINSNWHISGLEWGPDRIDFYLDGTKIRSYPVKPDSLFAMPMIIDLDANATNFCNGVDTVHTVFPFEFDVDYVKVYQLKYLWNTAKSICAYAPTTYDTLYKSLTFGGGSCTPTIPSSSNITHRATDYILLNDGFNVGNTTNLFLDILPCQTKQYYGARFAPYKTPPPPSYLLRRFYNY
jgi:hypothetical protein